MTSRPADRTADEASTADERESAAGCDHYSKSVDPRTWWNAHYDEATGAVLDFFVGDGISLTGKRIADIGCGDGIIDLGVAVKAEPEKIVGFDLLTTDPELLAGWAAKYAGLDALPDNLFFATSEPLTLPADDASFDYVISWSAFEHIADPVAILREVRRILVDDGVLFIQLWPFYHSAHGTHLVDWYPDGFAQFKHPHAEILRTVSEAGPPAMAAEMLEVYRTLNGITADDLQAALRKAGFRIVKVALDSEAVHLPEETAHLPLSTVAISGIKLLAVKAEPTDGPPPSKSVLDRVES
ncbi:MAG TPA: class I SAM-dependent methyltransferase [Jatrophihabitans sp.]|nr:class I SAM-dependent methyltransferase [Jatrophihabitans sp.]